MHDLRRASVGLLFLLSTFILSARADYHVDDTNTTLTYSSGPNVIWGAFAAGDETLQLLLPNGTYQVIDPYFCYNYTYRYAACSSADNCLLTIPFTGSGITVFVYQAGPVGINASITVDGAHGQTNVLSAPPAPNYEISNVSMFSVQQLVSGVHSLQMLVNDMYGSYSGMMFDYAYINETLVTNPTTTTTTSQTSTSRGSSTLSGTSISPPPPPSESSDSHTNIGAIVGGVIGGIAIVILGVLAFWWTCRRKQSHNDGPIAPYSPNSAHDPPQNHFNTTPISTLNDTTTAATMTSNLTPSRSMESSSFALLVPNRLGSTHDISSTTSASAVVTPFTATFSSTDPFPSAQSPQSTRESLAPMLTDEQADFINSLHQNNVPAAAIARVMERMLADRHAGIREWERETRLARPNTMTTAPPSYDLVGRRD